MGIAAREALLAGAAPDLYCVHGAGGRVTGAGANAREVLGIESTALRGPGLLENIHLHDRVAVARALDECHAAGTPGHAEFRLAGGRTDRTAGDRWYEMRCWPSGDDDGAVISTIRDISAWRRREDELRGNREKAESASAAKGLFLANMSHELRTPLNAILGFSELLQSNAMASMPPERHREYVELIHSSASHLLNVLNDILDMSKIEAGKYEIIAEPFDLGHCLRTCCSIMRGQAEHKGISIRLEGADGLPEVTADERAIKQIMINLLSNAIKFSGENSVVEIAAIRVGRNIRLTVTDRGIGISRENLASLGKPFYQADSRYDRKYQGTGLGLSVVRGLVELHRGKIVFDSVRGEGTTVTVTIPVHASDSRPVPAPEEFEVVRLRALSDEPRRELSMAGQARATASGARR